MKGHLFLIATIIAESLAIIFMKVSNQTQQKIYLIIGIVFYASSFFLLNNAVKHLPIGYTNAIWAGSSTILVCIAGYFFFNENIKMIHVLFLSLIVIGLVGLNYTGAGK